jgi:GNAT superfamily N-acetyltransferase
VSVDGVTVSTAARIDVPALCALLGELFAQEAEFRPDAEAQVRGLQRIIDDPSVGTILLARRGDAVLGMVNLLYTVSTALGERVALLEDMVVTGAARGTGIGSVLLRAAIAHARGAGCKRITLLTDGDNMAAQRFYARHGFEPSRMLALRLPLP